MGIQIPEDYGGAGMSAVDYCICIEELARVDPSVALTVAAHNGLCTAHIAMFGTEAQKQRYLVPLARGEKIGAWGLTEPTAGSDAGGTQTRAPARGRRLGAQRREDVHHPRPRRPRHGGHGGHRPVSAAGTASRPSSSSAGRPGMSPGRKENKLGMRASDTSEVIFDDCRGPRRSAARASKARGFVNAMQVLDAGRIGIAALAVGLAQGAHEAALRYAKERHQFGQPISSFQAIQWKLADDATAIEAARLLTYRAAMPEGPGRRGRRASRRWRSCSRARWPCASPTTACRSTAATGS